MQTGKEVISEANNGSGVMQSATKDEDRPWSGRSRKNPSRAFRMLSGWDAPRCRPCGLCDPTPAPRVRAIVFLERHQSPAYNAEGVWISGVGSDWKEYHTRNSESDVSRGKSRACLRHAPTVTDSK